jgi:hypothetical protein
MGLGGVAMDGMMRRAAVMAAVVLLGPAFGLASGATAAAGTRLAAGRDGSGGTWGTAKEVPGTAALNVGGDAGAGSMSCAAAGDCSAGGFYTDSSGHSQVFVVNQTSGTWAKAKEVPGTAALNVGGDASLGSVSCAAAGDCSAGGFYTDSSSNLQAFVVNETSGTWAKAKEVPGTAALNVGGDAEVRSVSCAAAGACSAGGFYVGSSHSSEPFVANETNGTWAKAKEVPGIAALDAGRSAEVNSVSCASAGDCSAGGFYADSSGHSQAFVVNETNGTWAKAKEVPGTAALNAGGDASLGSVSCAAAGDCSAGGFYLDGSRNAQVFVVNETNGTWGTAKEVPGTAALNTGNADLGSVSCAAAGNCSAGGFYTDGSRNAQVFVVNETNGTWGTAKEVPGTAALNTGGNANLGTVSCAAAGNCGTGGRYKDGSGHFQAFVVNETNGTWAKAEEVPGTAALNTGGRASVGSVSCAPTSNCSAGGNYTDSSGRLQAFVVSQT